MKLQTNFRDETRELLRTRPAHITIKSIAEAVKVSPQWINKFLNGNIENPGVCTIETLNKYLKETATK